MLDKATLTLEVVIVITCAALITVFAILGRLNIIQTIIWGAIGIIGFVRLAWSYRQDRLERKWISQLEE